MNGYRRKWRPRALVIAVFGSLLWPTMPAQSQTAPAAIDDFLASPWKRFSSDKVRRSWRIIVLSNIAELCANRWHRKKISHPKAKKCAGRVVRLAMDRRVRPFSTAVQRSRITDHGLYWSHLNVALGAFKHITGHDDYRKLNARITNHLQTRSLSEPTHHVPSYPGTTTRWPADQAVALYSVFLYDRNYGTQHIDEPLRKWLRYMQGPGMNNSLGLPKAEVTGVSKLARHPRGSAISWTVRYLATISPPSARTVWKQYQKHFRISVGPITGFREWPPGVARKADLHSGPIVHNIGAAATGLAIGASQAVGDSDTLTALLRTASSVRALNDPRFSRVGNSILSIALEENGKSLITWW